jgi:catechol 2,3-dioxygenase-like lactoylglutathione lyase family enzyme
LENAHLRIARPTDDLSEAIRFYRDGLGFELIDSFEDHQGFDGIMLGMPSLSYHLEFTLHRGYPVGKTQTQENLLVFYLPDQVAWQQRVNRMIKHGYQPVKSYNPYWDLHGKTFEDTAGYRVVLQCASWP